MTANAYETLYNKMKNNFTIVNENREYTLGEYMLMKANAVHNTENLPISREQVNNTSLTSIVSYVSNKLAVKRPPMRDKVVKRFPFRTSAAAFLCGLIACSLMFSYGLFSLNASSSTVPTAEIESTLTEEEIDTPAS